ncbi:pilus assembly protein N-terminal domain-containing protein [uncultured Roseibium sp.]|uniref:type II and III secretion system protein family protein n=1 Tax=uncultured Roseibium sp. TaxID=1936171 RepID=UPI0026245E1C|nr:pilus assembly protein N-terminal domain-containing protein [uncultured Roseibium sp.]
MWVIAVFALIASVSVTQAIAQNGDRTNTESQGTLHVEIGEGILIPNTASVEAVFVSDPKVADVKDSPEETIFLFGKSVGTASLIATDTNGHELFRYTVVVSHQLGEIRNMLKSRFPDETLSVRSSRGSILVSGATSNERVRKSIFASLEAAVPETAIIDETTVVASNLVRLDVKLLEVNKTRAEQFGVDINALIAANGFSIGVKDRGTITAGFSPQDQSSRLSATLDLLITNQVATVKTETSLSAVSGKQAIFEVGGEIPVPSFTTDGNTRDFSLNYKFVGLLLQFTPARLEEDKVLLNIASSVSSTEPSSLSINGNAFPTLNTRRFKTDVELADKQSFLIAGLSQQSSLASLRQPKRGNQISRGLADLFSSNRVESESRELIILVTAYFRRPKRKPVALDAFRSPSNLEYLVGLKTRRKSVTIHGAVGFIY